MTCSASPPRQRAWVAVLATLSSALLLVLSYHPADWGLLAWVAPVPWLVSLCHPRPWRPLLLSWLLGLIYQAGGLWWITTVTTLGLALTVQPLALYFLLIGGLVLLYRRRLGGPLYLFVPLLWVGLEWVRSWFLSGLGWLYIGHTQWSVPTLIQIADLGGAYLVSLLVLLVASVIADIFAGIHWPEHRSGKTRLLTGIALAMLALVGSYWYGRVRLAEAEFTVGPKISLIQGNIPQEVKNTGIGMTLREMRDLHVGLTRRAADERPRPELIVWAETMLGRSPSTDAEERDMLRELARRTDATLLIGLNLELPDNRSAADPWRVYNSLLEIKPDGQLGRSSDKTRLVPVGEYMPLRGVLPWIPIVVRNMVGYVPDVAAGRERELFELGQFRYGALICHESIYPWLARDLRRKGAQFIINPTNDGWFKESAELDQVLAICVFRAVENRLSVVRAANTGISAFIDPDGRVRKVLSVNGQTKSVRGVLTDSVYLDSRQTLYSKIGDLPAIGCLIGALLISIAACLRKPASVELDPDP